MTNLTDRLALAVWDEAGDTFSKTILTTVIAELDAAGYQIVPKVLDDDMMEAAHVALIDAMSGIRPECLTEEIPLNILSIAVFDAALSAAPKMTR